MKTTFVNFNKKREQILDIVDTMTKNSTTFLGVTLDNNLRWNEHIDNVCKKMNSGVYVIRHMK